MKIKFLALALLLIFPSEAGKCNGRFVNPVSDICWSCLFPITIGGIKVSPSGEDTGNLRDLLCTCRSEERRVGKEC